MAKITTDAPQAPKFTVVTARLFTEDVEELKQQSQSAGELEWQPRLRLLVHRALRRRKAKMA